LDRETVTSDPHSARSGDAAGRDDQDSDLLRRFTSGGEQEAFASLVRHHGPAVLGVCRRILGASGEADDAYQATFLVLARRAASVRRGGSVGGWLRGVATRISLRLRARRLRAEGSGDRGSLHLVPDSRGEDPLRAACRADEGAALAQELGTLPEEYRGPLVLCHLEGRTTEEAAGRLGVPVGTLRSRLVRARELLRARLTRRGLTASGAALAALIGGPAEAAVPQGLERATEMLSRTAAGLTPRAAALAKETLRAMRIPKLLAGTAGLTLLAILGFALPVPGDAPRAAKAGGTVVVANQRSATAQLIDVVTGKVRATVKTDPCPHEVAVSPKGTTAAVSNYGLPFGPGPGSTLTLIDVKSGKATKTIALGGKHTRPHGLAWLDEGRLLCTSEADESLIEVDVKLGKVTRRMATDQAASHMVAVPPDGKRAYTANVMASTVSAFDLAKGGKVRDIGVGKEPEGIAVSPDGRRVWVGNRGDKTVSVIDTEGLRVAKTLPAAGMPFRIAFAPGGKAVVVTEPMGGELAIYDAATMKEKKRVKFSGGAVEFDTPGPKAGPMAVAFSPDGKLAYCTVYVAKAVAVIDLEKGEVVRKFDTGAGPDGIAYSSVVID
jgi:RNA polymerase sigma factor (sigma-70 family)